MPDARRAYAGVRSFASAGDRSFSDGANPFRVYYPVDTKPRFSSRASFVVGPLSTLRAYLHVFFGPFFPSLRAPPSFRNPWCGELHASMRHPTVGGWAWQVKLAPLLLWPIAVLMWLLSAVPETVVDAPARAWRQSALLVFSRGLIGSGEETVGHLRRARAPGHLPSSRSRTRRLRRNDAVPERRRRRGPWPL